VRFDRISVSAADPVEPDCHYAADPAEPDCRARDAKDP
jgi:hypothetical protein